MQATVTARQNALVSETLIDCFNSRDYVRLASLLAPSCRWNNIPFGLTFDGLEGGRQFMEGWALAFPDGRVEILSLVPTDECVTVEFRFVGLHKGLLNGPDGPIKATGRPVDVRVCEVQRFSEGLITDINVYFDSRTLLRQLNM